MHAYFWRVLFLSNKFNFEKFWKVGASLVSIMVIAVLLAAFPLNARLKRVEEVQAEQKEATKNVKATCKEQLEFRVGYIKDQIEEIKTQMSDVTSI